MKISKLKRVFVFNDITLQDPNPSFSIEEVKSFYQSQYPGITTAEIIGPETDDTSAIYKFVTKVGTKA